MTTRRRHAAVFGSLPCEALRAYEERSWAMIEGAAKTRTPGWGARVGEFLDDLRTQHPDRLGTADREKLERGAGALHVHTVSGVHSSL